MDAAFERDRPILRIFEDGEVIEVSSSSVEHAGTGETSARAAVTSGDGEFGGGGIHNVLTVHKGMQDGSRMMLRADVATPRVPAGYGSSQELEAGYERRVGFDGAVRTVVRYQSHPELIGAGSGDGVQVFSVTSARRMNLGEQLQVEVGGKLAGCIAVQVRCRAGRLCG